jgi:hypothetical protein
VQKNNTTTALTTITTIAPLVSTASPGLRDLCDCAHGLPSNHVDHPDLAQSVSKWSDDMAVLPPHYSPPRTPQSAICNRSHQDMAQSVQQHSSRVPGMHIHGPMTADEGQEMPGQYLSSRSPKTAHLIHSHQHNSPWPRYGSYGPSEHPQRCSVGFQPVAQAPRRSMGPVLAPQVPPSPLLSLDSLGMPLYTKACTIGCKTVPNAREIEQEEQEGDMMYV